MLAFFFWLPTQGRQVTWATAIMAGKTTVMALLSSMARPPTGVASSISVIVAPPPLLLLLVLPPLRLLFIFLLRPVRIISCTRWLVIIFFLGFRIRCGSSHHCLLGWGVRVHCSGVCTRGCGSRRVWRCRRCRNGVDCRILHWIFPLLVQLFTANIRRR